MHSRFCAALAMIAIAAPTANAVQQEVTRPQLCSVADAVVVGRVVDLETLWAAIPEGGIERHAFFEAGRVLRGPAERRFEVVLPGGTLGQLHHRVEDVPDLQRDASYMLFLTKADYGWQVIGGEGGAVRIATGGPVKGETIADAAASIGACHAR